MEKHVIERLTAFTVPPRLPVDDDNEREQRNWILRFEGAVPGDDTSSLSAEMTTVAVRAVGDALGERGLPDEAEPRRPIVRIVPVDNLHVILNIRTVKLEEDKAHAYLVAASAVLRRLHESVRIDDVQGLPLRFWRHLVGNEMKRDVEA